MVDRIDKIDGAENYWKIAASTETDKEKSHQEQDSRKKDVFDSLGEKTDWKSLFDKSKLWNHNIQLGRDETKQVLFRKLNLKTDPSLLKVDVELNGGETITPAFISISRSVGLQIKNLKNGDAIPLNLIFQGDLLRLTIPTNPELFIQEEEKAKQQMGQPAEVETDPLNEPTVKSRPPKNKSAWRAPEMLMIYGTALLAIVVMIIIFIIFRAIS